MNRLVLMIGTAAVVAAAPADAQRRKQVTPYIEVGQVLTADLDGPSDVLTYTSIAAGVDASVQTARVEVQVNYRFEHREGWGDRVEDGDIHSGLARAAVKLGYGLNFESGALATLARTDLRGAAPGSFAGNPSNLSQVYAAYLGPTLATHVGEATLNAAYRFGYTKVEEPSLPAFLPGQPRLDNFDDSTVHMATASLGTRAGTYAPFGMTLSGGWVREGTSQLDQRYDGKFARFDAVQPVSPTLAVTAGVGYENIEISQRDPAVDASGAPVIDNNGRFVTDPASPRRIAYDFDGLFYDAGVIWRPSSRTTLTGRVGRRYDSMTYLGSLSYQTSSRSGLQIGVYDSVTSFGRGLNDALSRLPTSFAASNDPFGNQFGGCIFATGEGTNRGACLNSSLGGVTTANYRARGVDGVFTTAMGPYTLGFGGGYSNRRYLLPTLAIGTPLVNVTDEIYYAQAFASRTLGQRSTLSANAYLNYFDSGILNGSDVLAAGANTSYSYSFGRLGATASLGVFGYDQEFVGSDVSAQGLVGMRYSF
ncbi:hypothetical protein M9980_06145 [Sphingomonas donggukensis]|uniref:Preprotein translocase subunit YajC n=1 Tax=Sphingomonas donggukensis TaxID=2949093 RepID=A0ABY4U1V7_9SPHN|nr:hypothetical protein [Sphingomonas donggukensis]URW76776.1 hypothetical protein M9980_06145 [Sphingomonas donggukensis]